MNFCPMCGQKIIHAMNICSGCGLNLPEYQRKLDRLKAEKFSTDENLKMNVEKKESSTSVSVIPFEKSTDILPENDNLPMLNVKDMTATEILGAGYDAENEKNYKLAMQYYISAVKFGSEEALYRQAMLLANGNGVVQDEVKAFGLLKKAADVGCIPAMYEVGIRYLKGIGTQTNDVEGVKMLEKAASKYFAPALLDTAFAYDMLKNAPLALSFWSLRQAAALRFAPAVKLDNLDKKDIAQKAYDQEKDTYVFSMMGYKLSFPSNIFTQSLISTRFEQLSDMALEDFIDFYNKAEDMDEVATDAYDVGKEILINVAKHGVYVFSNFGKYDVTEELLVSAPASNLRTQRGRILHTIFSEIPEQIWKDHESKIRKQYRSIVASAQAERDYRKTRKENRARWHARGYDMVDYMYNSMGAGILNMMEGAAHSAFNAAGNAVTSLSESSSKKSLYENQATILTYTLGIAKAVTALKYRILGLLDFGNTAKDEEKCNLIIQNITNGSYHPDKLRHMLAEALVANPTNIKVYRLILEQFGDADRSLENMAIFMSIDKEVITQLKTEVLIQSLKNNNKVSDALKNEILSDKNSDVIKILSGVYLTNPDQFILEYNLTKVLSIRLQVRVFENNRIGKIFDVYGSMSESYLAAKHYSENVRIPFLKHHDEKMFFAEIPKGIKIIGGYAFAGCKNLRKIKFPNTLKQIEAGAFAGCNIKNLIIPDGVIEISVNITDGENIVHLPNTIERITGNFNIAVGRAKFSFDRPAMPLLNTYFKETQQYNELVSILTADTAREDFQSGRLITSAGIIPSGIFNDKNIFGNGEFSVHAGNVQIIEERAFANSYVSKVTLGISLRRIYDEAFLNCNRLKNIILPKGITRIGARIFENCTKLEYVSIPDTVISIGDDFLKNCSAIVYCTPNSFAETYCKKNNLQYKDGAAEIFEYAQQLAEESSTVNEMAEAISYYTESANMGNMNASYELGKCYINNLGVAKSDKNVDVAIAYFYAAAEIGHKEAMYELYKIYKKKLGLIKSDEKFAKKMLDLSGHNEGEEVLTNNVVSGYETLLNFIAQLDRKYRGMECVYFANNNSKNRTKIESALDTYASNARKETVIFSYDDTLFGGADDGFLVTNKNLYWHNAYEDAGVIALSQVKAIAFKNKELWLNGQIKINMSMFNKSDVTRMSDMLKEIISYTVR